MPRNEKTRWERTKHSDGTVTFLPAGYSTEGMLDITPIKQWPYRLYVGANDTRRYDCAEFYQQYLKEIEDGNS